MYKRQYSSKAQEVAEFNDIWQSRRVILTIGSLGFPVCRHPDLASGLDRKNLFYPQEADPKKNGR
jgi:hypothetical protein